MQSYVDEKIYSHMCPAKLYGINNFIFFSYSRTFVIQH